MEVATTRGDEPVFLWRVPPTTPTTVPFPGWNELTPEVATGMLKSGSRFHLAGIFKNLSPSPLLIQPPMERAF